MNAERDIALMREAIVMATQAAAANEVPVGAVVVIDGSGPDEMSDCVPTDVLPAGFDDVFVVVGQVEGDWYVSYIETVLAYAELFVEAELAN